MRQDVRGRPAFAFAVAGPCGECRVVSAKMRREARDIATGANVRKQGKDYSNADLVCYDDDIQVV